jgi:putative oxidoreductase
MPSSLISALRDLNDLHEKAFALFRRLFGGDLLGLLARLALAGVFWRSLLTKVETTRWLPYTEDINGFMVEKAHLRVPEMPLTMRETTYHQFASEPFNRAPLLSPEVAAWMATLAEFALPLLLLFGLLTRLSAGGLIGMTLVIQIFVFGEGMLDPNGTFWTSFWGTHSLWLCLGVYLAAYGPGRFSLDAAFKGVFARQA